MFRDPDRLIDRLVELGFVWRAVGVADVTSPPSSGGPKSCFDSDFLVERLRPCAICSPGRT